MKQGILSRRHRTKGLAAAFFALLAGAQVAGAQVSFYGAQKTAFYNQTGDNAAPAAATDYSAFGFVNTTNAGDAASFTVVDNDLIALPASSNPTSFGGSNFYATKSALDQAFTPGDDYTFTAQGGSLDGQSGTLPIGTDAYAPLLYLTGTGYTRAQSVNPGGGFTFALGSTGGEAPATGLGFSLYDPAGNQVYSITYAAGTTSVTLSQSTIDALKSGEAYTASLNNFNTANVSGSGDFATANDSDGFVTTTSFTIEVVPEPGQTAILLTGFAILAAWGRRASGALLK